MEDREIQLQILFELQAIRELLERSEERAGKQIDTAKMNIESVMACLPKEAQPMFEKMFAGILKDKL